MFATVLLSPVSDRYIFEMGGTSWRDNEPKDDGDQDWSADPMELNRRIQVRKTQNLPRPPFTWTVDKLGIVTGLLASTGEGLPANVQARIEELDVGVRPVVLVTHSDAEFRISRDKFASVVMYVYLLTYPRKPNSCFCE